MQSTQPRKETKLNKKPKTYTVTVANAQTKEVLTEFTTDILVVAGVLKPVSKEEQVPVTLFHLGTPMQLNNLLAFINTNIMPIILGIKKSSKKIDEESEEEVNYSN